MSQFKKIRTIVTILIIFLTTFFLIRTLINFYGSTEVIISLTPIWKIIFSAILFLGYLYFRAISWKYIVAYFGETISQTNSLTIWFFSEAVRYIPGNIWSFASRAYLARQNNITKKTSLIILPAEIIVAITITTILSLYAIGNVLESHLVNFIFFIVIFVSLIITLALLLFHGYINKILKNLTSSTVVLKALLIALMLQFVSWTFYGFGYLVLINNFTTTPNFILLFSYTLLAWLIGYLTIITPMGIGVREGAFVLLAGSQLGTPQAIVIAILARIILIITEITNILFWAIMMKKFNRNK